MTRERTITGAQIKPSFTATEKNKNLLEEAKSKFRHALDPANTNPLIGDAVEFTKAASGVTTENAKRALKRYKDAEINELVAHSWGCELIYSAILNGDIRPPKKLILAGVPDDDFAKWEMLAARTGTEVHWARAGNDIVAQDGAKLAKKAAAGVDFKAKWDALCGTEKTKNRCPAHNRQPKPVIIETIGNLKGLGHDRFEYYDVLKRKTLANTYQDLRTQEMTSLEAETHRVRMAALEDAQRTATGLVYQAREKAKVAARRDHDDRLMDAYINLANRSCAAPGSVPQSEFDALAQPYDPGFYLKRIPHTLGDCVRELYSKIAASLVPVAEEIETLARSYTPQTPVAIVAIVVPQAARAADYKTPSGFNPPVLPDLRNFALTACRAPDQAVIVQLDSPSYNYAYKDVDDSVATDLAAGVGDCPRKLFYQLIAVIRAGEYWKVDRQWIRDTVAAYSPAPSPTRTGGNQSRSENTTPRDSPKHDAEGEALRQLKAQEDAAMRKRFRAPPR